MATIMRIPFRESICLPSVMQRRLCPLMDLPFSLVNVFVEFASPLATLPTAITSHHIFKLLTRKTPLLLSVTVGTIAEH